MVFAFYGNHFSFIFENVIDRLHNTSNGPQIFFFPKLMFRGLFESLGNTLNEKKIIWYIICVSEGLEIVENPV